MNLRLSSQTKMELLKKQTDFIFNENRVVIFRAGVRSGKTIALTYWSIIRALKNRVVCIVEPTANMCRTVFLDKLKQSLTQMSLFEGKHYTINYTDLIIRFRGLNRAKIMLKSAETKLIGFDADDGAIDEFCFIRDDGETYRDLLQRLSESEDAQVRLTSSPASVLWAQKLEENPDNVVIHQTLLENHFLPRSYIAALKSEFGEDSKYYRQQVLGEYVNLEDGVIDVSRLIQVPYHIPHGCAFVRAWDTASSAKTSADFTASCLMSINNGIYTIHDVTKQKGAFSSLQQSIVDKMRNDPPGTYQLIENTGAGQVIMSVLKALPELRGIHIQPVDAINDKISRALPLSGKIAAGAVHYCAGNWNKDFLSEMEQFGAKCPHDDQVDSAAHAFNWLSKPKSSATNFNFL